MRAIALAVLFFVFMLGCGDGKDTTSSQATLNKPDDLSDIKEGEATDSSAFSLPSNTDLFPDNASPLVISYYMRYIDPPPVGKRQRLITNYETKISPFPGWALALTRFRTSLRFEFYLKDKDNKGGWNTLAPLTLDKEINPNTWFALTFLVDPSSLISSVYAEVDEEFNTLENFIPVTSGISIEPLGDVKANSLFLVTSGTPRKSYFKAELKEVSIFKLDALPKADEFINLAKGGPRSLKKVYSKFCSLTLEGDGAEFCKTYPKNN